MIQEWSFPWNYQSLASWLSAGMSPFSPTKVTSKPVLQNSSAPVLEYGCGEIMSTPAVLGASQFLVPMTWARETAQDHGYFSSTNAKLSWEQPLLSTE